MQPFTISLPNGGTITGHSSIPDQVHAQPRGTPLLVGLHGGTYNSTYFDAYPGTSTEPTANALGIPFVSLDRPGYRGSTPYPADTVGEDDIEKQGRYLASIVFPTIWQRFGLTTGASSAIIISHSIGSTVATVAGALNDSTRFPLAGVIISGIGSAAHAMSEPPQFEEAKVPGYMETDLHLKLEQMLRLPQGLADPAPQLKYTDVHNATPLGELTAIGTSWPQSWRKWAAQVTAPVLYSLAEFDNFWAAKSSDGVTDAVKEFADAFVKSESVDAALWKGTPHCIEHSYMGRAWIARCFSFALECATRRELGRGDAALDAKGA